MWSWEPLLWWGLQHSRLQQLSAESACITLELACHLSSLPSAKHVAQKRVTALQLLLAVVVVGAAIVVVGADVVVGAVSGGPAANAKEG